MSNTQFALDPFCNIQSEADYQKQAILDSVNEEQRKVVQQIDGFVVTGAGAGSGKSHTMIARAAYMIASGIPASSILMFTFTKKAANELAMRVEKQIGSKAFGLTVSTYHSFCARQLRNFAAYAGYQDNFTIIDPDDQKKLIKDILGKINSHEKPEDMIGRISKLKDKHWTPQAAALYTDKDVLAKEAVLAYEMYQKQLKQNNLMDFDDLIFNMITIMEKHEIVRQKIWNRFKYIMIDETQDSSVSDVKLAFLLMNPKTKNLCIVGDRNQSIYKFRGADMENLFKRIEEHKPQKFFLERNYRSTKNIVNAAQSLIRYNYQPDKRGSYSMNKEGDKVVHVSVNSPAEEASMIASIVQKAVKSGEAKHKDFAILYRTSYQSRNIEDAFVRLAIPYKIHNGTSFYARKEIRDIVSYLDFIVNPRNTLSLERIVNIPKSGLGKKTLAKFIDFYSQEAAKYAILSLKDSLDIFQKAKQTIPRAENGLELFRARLSNVLEYLDSVEGGEPKSSCLIQKIITEFHYFEYLRKEDEETFSDRSANVFELQNLADTYDDLHDFLESVYTMTGENQEEEKGDEETDQVTLMTMHGSKGLEFRFVFIVDANAGVIPSYRCETDADIQEERRLFYVAMTRAEESLYIFSTRHSMRNGLFIGSNPSPFIGQINEKYLDSVMR